jgi:hypothetical protein
MLKLSIIVTLLALTGCASVAGQKMQPILVQTVHDNIEVGNVGCTLANDAGSWFLTTPASVMVHKSTGDLVIDCKKDNLSGNQTLVSKSNGAVWGNILIGGGIGYIVDRNTGAGFDYPPPQPSCCARSGRLKHTQIGRWLLSAKNRQLTNRTQPTIPPSPTVPKI